MIKSKNKFDLKSPITKISLVILVVILTLLGWYLLHPVAPTAQANGTAVSDTTQQEPEWVIETPARNEELFLISKTENELEFESLRLEVKGFENGMKVQPHEATVTITKSSIDPNYYRGKIVESGNIVAEFHLKKFDDECYIAEVAGPRGQTGLVTIREKDKTCEP